MTDGVDTEQTRVSVSDIKSRHLQHDNERERDYKEWNDEVMLF